MIDGATPNGRAAETGSWSLRRAGSEPAAEAAHASVTHPHSHRASHHDGTVHHHRTAHGDAAVHHDLAVHRRAAAAEAGGRAHGTERFRASELARLAIAAGGLVMAAGRLVAARRLAVVRGTIGLAIAVRTVRAPVVADADTHRRIVDRHRRHHRRGYHHRGR